MGPNKSGGFVAKIVEEDAYVPGQNRDKSMTEGL